jgi:excisionase family DNA binding protein
MNAMIEDKLLKKRQVAEVLSCSTRTIEREAKDGRLTRVKIRGGVRFRLSEVQTIISRGGL